MPMEGETVMETKRGDSIRKCCRNSQATLRFFVSEFVGTAFMVIIITSASCQLVLSGGTSGNAVSSFFGMIFGITFAIYLSLKGSGGHINPIVTFVMVLIKQTPRRYLIVYWAAQYIGAFIGAALVYGVYFDAFNAFDHGNRTVFGDYGTGAIFTSFPESENISILTCIFDQLLSSAILIIGILVITDSSNTNLPMHLIPPLAGILVGMIIACLGHNCHAPLNPAKDFSSRLLMIMAGWGTQPFSYRGFTWWYIPLIVPHVGAVLGLIGYKAFAKAVLPPKRAEEELEEILPPNLGTGLTKLLRPDGVEAQCET